MRKRLSYSRRQVKLIVGRSLPNAGLGIKHRGWHLYEEGPLGGGHEAIAVHVGYLHLRRRN